MSGVAVQLVNVSFRPLSFSRSPGFNGLHCEHNIDDCPGHNCQNGGVCVDGVNTYNCQCPPHYTGDNFATGMHSVFNIRPESGPSTFPLAFQASTARRTWTSAS